jgi:hypothetical protein
MAPGRLTTGARLEHHQTPTNSSRRIDWLAGRRMKEHVYMFVCRGERGGAQRERARERAREGRRATRGMKYSAIANSNVLTLLSRISCSWAESADLAEQRQHIERRPEIAGPDLCDGMLYTAFRICHGGTCLHVVVAVDVSATS